ncbi:unnamed protein product [Rotaria sp. Silwood1]|nr:unnamed protein product [Rotaria sp. Silwood1]
MYLDRDRLKTLSEKFNAKIVPALIVLSPTGDKITSNGVEEVRVASKKALEIWPQGKSLFWSREPREGEYVWQYTACTVCYMRPLIGSRHGCTHQECSIALCETCLPKNNHEHPLVEYLMPKRTYSLEAFIGIYFCAHWCSPCRDSTPKLAELYKEAQESAPGFRIVFVSCDRDEESFNNYRAEMPWLTVPLNASAVLKEYFWDPGEYMSSLFIP